MTNHLVRVFRNEDGKIDETRIAIWCGDAWVELEVDMLEVIDGDAGALASVILPCHVGHESLRSALPFSLREIKPTRQRGKSMVVPLDPPITVPTPHESWPGIPEECKVDGPFEHVPSAANEAKFGGVGEKPLELPTWGDDAKRVRFFTITTEDGRVFPNHSTNRAGSDESAAQWLCERWNKLTAGQSGKTAVKVELQPEGRTGGTPTSAPRAAGDELDKPDEITSE